MSGASGYLVDEWINGAWKQIGNFGSGVTSVSVTGLSPGTTYNFDVAAYNSSGTTWANSQSATSFKAAPRRPRHSRPRPFQRRRSIWPGTACPAPAVTWSMSGSTAPGSKSATYGSGTTGMYGHRLEPQHHLLLRRGRLQLGRHDLGELPERHHVPEQPPAAPSRSRPRRSPRRRSI